MAGPSIHKWVCLLAMSAFLCGLALPAASARQETDWDVQTIRGLTQRRLFDLAGTYAEQRLNADGVSSRLQVDIVVALIESLSQAAYQSQDETAWELAQRTADKWRNIQSPRQILVSVQGVLIDQLRIEKIVREIQADAEQPQQRETAMSLVSKTVRRMEALQSEARSLLNRRPTPREEADWLSADELLSLRRNLQYQQARLQHYRADLFPANEESSRNDILTIVETQLNDVIQPIRADKPLWWQVQADRVAAARKLGNFRLAEQIVRSLPKASPDRSSKERVIGEWLRTLVRMNRLDDAQAIAGKDPFATSTPEYDLARLQTFIVVSRKTSDRTWQQRALQLTSDIERNHGGYWGRLANLAVVGTATSSANAGDASSLGLLVRVADEAQRKQQWDAALKALDSAYANAVQQGLTEQAWKLGFRAASIEQQQNNHINASQRFFNLANQLAEWQESHTAQLMGCWNVARLLGSDTDQLESYETELNKLIEKWPTSASAHQGRLWLAKLKRQQGRQPEAFQLLLNIDPTVSVFVDAVSELRILTRSYCRTNPPSNASVQKLLATIQERYNQLLDAELESQPEHWESARQELLVAVSELELVYLPPLDGRRLTALNDQLERGRLKPALSRDAELLSNLAALQTGQAGMALQLSEDTAARQQQLSLLLTGLRADSTDKPRANGLLLCFNQVSKSVQELPLNERRAWHMSVTEALIVANEKDAAIKFAEDLIDKTYPKDATVQLFVARLFSSLITGPDDQAMNQRSLSQWRRVARSSRPNTENWFMAKYHVAKQLKQLGQAEDALKLLKYIQAVPPGWKDAANANQLQALFQELGGN